MTNGYDEPSTDKLYKFYSIRKVNEIDKYNENLLKMLKSSSLWFSMAKNFNDPYDCYKELVSYRGPEVTNAMGELKKLIYSKSTLDRAGRRKQVREAQKRPNYFIDAYESTLQPIIDSHGICCFTTNPLSILMWSHYGDCHRGLCLEFDYKELRHQFDIHKVNYKDDFVPSYFFDNQEQALVDLFTTKSKEWSYEQEYRAIREPFGLASFRRSSLSKVIFGCNASLIDIAKIRDNMTTFGYKNMLFKQTLMNNNND